MAKTSNTSIDGTEPRDDIDVTYAPDLEGGTLADAPAASDGQRSAVQGLKAQAGDKLCTYADDGKARATDVLANVADMIQDAAGQIDEKVGVQFGDYARSASTTVSGFADTLRDKDVDAILEDAKAFVRKSPAVAIGTAAALGFVLARILRSGNDARRDA